MKNNTELDDDLRPEYDLHLLLREATRGKYASRYEAGTNIVLLEPDVAAAFPDDRAVNDALRLVLKLARIPVAVEDNTSQ
jgi:hypothetical protein